MEIHQAILEVERKFRSVFARLPVIVGNEAVNFTLDNFRMQGFMGNTFQRWLPRKQSWGNKKFGGKNILIGVGRLRRSIRITHVSANMVAIGSDVKYARAHNEGLRLGVIQTVKGFTRRNGTTVSGHQRRIDMRIPQRRFMGPSPYLNARLKRVALAEFMKENKFIRP